MSHHPPAVAASMLYDVFVDDMCGEDRFPLTPIYVLFLLKSLISNGYSEVILRRIVLLPTVSVQKKPIPKITLAARV